MSEGYFYEADWEIIRGDAASIIEVWSDASDGSAVNISPWSFRFEANQRNPREATPGNIIVDNASVVISTGTSGVKDTLIIPFTSGDTTVNEGRYDYDIKVTIGSTPTTYARGTLTILPSEQD